MSSFHPGDPCRAPCHWEIRKLLSSDEKNVYINLSPVYMSYLKYCYSITRAVPGQHEASRKVIWWGPLFRKRRRGASTGASGASQRRNRATLIAPHKRIWCATFSAQLRHPPQGEAPSARWGHIRKVRPHPQGEATSSLHDRPGRDGPEYNNITVTLWISCQH